MMARKFRLALTGAVLLIIFGLDCTTGRSYGGDEVTAATRSDTTYNTIPTVVTSSTVQSNIPLPKSAELLAHNYGYSPEDKAQLSIEGNCEILNITTKSLRPVREETRGGFVFYVWPQPTFKLLTFKLVLENALDASEEFNAGPGVEVSEWQEVGAEKEGPWYKVEVEHVEHRSLGLNTHGLRVTVDDEPPFDLETDYWWIINKYKGIMIYAEGDAQILTNCPPEFLSQETHASRYSGYSTWMMAGLLVTTVLLLAVLIGAWLNVKLHKTDDERSMSSKVYPVYEEFDEEMLENIRKKVDALRGPKTPEGCLTQGSPENPYAVLGVRGASPAQQQRQHPQSYTPTPAARGTSRHHTYQNTTSLVTCGAHTNPCVAQNV